MNGIIRMPGKPGLGKGSSVPIAVQGSQEVVMLKLLDYEDVGVDLTAATLTGAFSADDGVTVYSVTGVLTPDGDQVTNKGLFTWAHSAADVGLPDEYKLQIFVSGLPHHSFWADYVVMPSLNATAVIAPPLVGVPSADAAYLTALIAANQTAEAWIPENAAFVTAGATYTTLAANGASGLLCPVLSAITLADGMATGYQFPAVRTGTGVVTIAAATTLVESVSGSGLVTLASVTLETTAVLLHLGADVWLITGDYS